MRACKRGSGNDGGTKYRLVKCNSRCGWRSKLSCEWRKTFVPGQCVPRPRKFSPYFLSSLVLNNVIQNWGSQPFQNNVAIEHWGRGRLGEYSIVWSTVLAPSGTTYATVYVAANNKIITASCDPGSFSLTAIPADATPTTGTLTGYSLKVDLGRGQTLHLTITIAEVVSNDAPVYVRWTGSMSGRVSGGKLITGGVATFEEFNLS